jgi:hypothetical protein
VAPKRLTTEGLAETMHECAEHATRELTTIELEEAPPVEVAINAARYYRGRAVDVRKGELYARWLG